MKMPASKLPRLKYFAGMDMMNKMMKMNGDMEPMGMKMSLQEMDMNQVMYPEMENAGGHEMNDMDPAMHHEDPGMHKATYVCPMHPEVISDKPGKCPTCGMDLVAKDSEEIGSASCRERVCLYV